MTERQAVYESVECLPADVCNLIVGYVTERPHTWTVDAAMSVDIQSSDVDPNRIDVKPRRTNQQSWRILVSTQPFAESQLEWTVEFQGTSDHRNIGAGVTFRSSNACVENGYSFRLMAYVDDWIIHPDGWRRSFVSFHNLQESDVIPFDANWNVGRYGQKFRYRLSFTADWTKRTVTARIGYSCNNGLYRINDCVLISDMPPNDFKRLRPCVVVTPDAAEICVRSGVDLTGRPNDDVHLAV